MLAYSFAMLVGRACSLFVDFISSLRAVHVVWFWIRVPCVASILETWFSRHLVRFCESCEGFLALWLRRKSVADELW